MDTLEQLIAKFDREYPDDMKLAREALQANPLKASDLIGIDITDALLCHEINRLRAELANSEKACAAKMRRIEMALRAVLTMAREADRRRCAVSASNVAEICKAALAAKGE